VVHYVCLIADRIVHIDMETTMSHPATRLLADAGPTVSISVAAKVLGISRAHAHALAARGELGVRVLQLGGRRVVPTIELRRVVGLVEEPKGAA